MKRKSDIAKEPASIWLRRKEAFDKMAETVIASRQKYRDAISLKCGGDGGPWGQPGDGLQNKRVNYSSRYLRWFRAQCMGYDPVIEYPREAEGDEVLAEMAEILLLRVLQEGCAMKEWRDTYPDKCWLGSSVVWYGYHAQIIGGEQVDAASESPGDAVDRALEGDLEVREGQDHDLMAAALRAPADDEVEGMRLGPDGRAALRVAAQEHDQARADQAARARDVRVKDRQIWFKRGVWGVDSAFDPTATDPADWEWVCQRVVMRVEDAKNNEAFKSSARAKLRGTEIGQLGVEEKRRVRTQGIEDVEDETKRVIIYIFWDKRNDVRHYISPELPDEYLEADEANPYSDERGERLIPDFFPCGYSVPDLPSVDIPERCFGMPLVAYGWQQESDADGFSTMLVSDANKHSRRDYILNPNLKNKDAVREALRGPSGAIIDGTGLDPDQLDKAVVPIQFRGSSGEVEQALIHTENQWVKNQGMPYAELSSQPQADTATQEELGIASGRSEAEEVITQDQEAFAKMLEGVRGLVRGLYSDEKVFALLGPSFAQKFDMWRSSALDGDTMRITFGPRARREENVKLSLLQKSIELAMGYTGPMGLPIFDMRPYYEELFRKLGQGKPIEVAPEAMQMRQLVDHLVAQIEELQQQVATAKQEGRREVQQRQAGANKSGPKKKASGAKKTPKESTMNSGTRRGTSSPD